MKLKQTVDCLKDGKVIHLTNSQGEPFCGFEVSDNARFEKDGCMRPCKSNIINCIHCVELLTELKKIL